MELLRDLIVGALGYWLSSRGLRSRGYGASPSQLFWIDTGLYLTHQLVQLLFSSRLSLDITSDNMRKTNQLAFTLSSTLAALGTVSSTPIFMCALARPSPYITAITTDPRISGLQLTQTPDSVPYTTAKVTLSSSGFHGKWDYAGGGLGAYVGGLGGCHAWWLNIGTSLTSVKPLTWDFDAKDTTIWSGGLGLNLTTTALVSQRVVVAPTNTFIACDENGLWVLYLQQGTDFPVGDCVETRLQEGTTSV
ncbi:hypothetical protein FRB94_000891 [Tulasnella sp. JGI-2019a]|nr:hypothetical protein FRB94_000891 [Tulasnella sp. JGI-2019a]